MSQQHIDMWNSSAEAFSQRYDAVTDEQWSAPTPCGQWTVKELVDHAVGVQAGYMGGLMDLNVSEGADWPTVRDAISSSLGAEGALEGMTEMQPMGTVPKTVPFGVAASDLLIHTWDLARAIGADETLPPGPVAAAHAGLQRFPEAGLRAEGMFGPEVECADDADEQTKMLSYAGRHV